MCKLTNQQLLLKAIAFLNKDIKDKYSINDVVSYTIVDHIINIEFKDGSSYRTDTFDL